LNVIIDGEVSMCITIDRQVITRVYKIISGDCNTVVSNCATNISNYYLLH